MTAPHDPTRAGAPVPEMAARFSRSEIEALCLKAARGAGLSWGLAEEAGMAARRLAEAGLPGPEWLLAWLDGPRGGAPRIDGTRWHAAEGGLCPLTAGTALADLGAVSGAGLALSDVVLPGLILPFLTVAASDGGLSVTWTGGMAAVSVAGIAVTGTVPDRADLRIAPGPAPAAPMQHGGRAVPLEIWRRLDALALATTVPPSAGSRAGAGASGSDND